MSFNVETVLKDMLGAAAEVLKGEWPKAKDAMESVLKEEAGALKSIAEARIRGDIDDDELESQLEDEKATLEAGLAMVAVVAKVSLQNAVNAAINVFWKAVKGAIDTAI